MLRIGFREVCSFDELHIIRNKKPEISSGDQISIVENLIRHSLCTSRGG